MRTLEFLVLLGKLHMELIALDAPCLLPHRKHLLQRERLLLPAQLCVAHDLSYAS